jgi:hypothetical protein
MYYDMELMHVFTGNKKLLKTKKKKMVAINIRGATSPNVETGLKSA